jgi:hypothetical protein
MVYNLKETIKWIMIGFIALGCVLTVNAQTFTKITDPNNPIVTDSGPDGYSGASWIDFDNDDDLDLFINNTKLYRNDGNGTFVSLTTTLGTGQPITSQIIGNGNSWADFDNDGDLDVFISSANSYLYRNDGGGNFTQITSGEIGNGFANRGWSCAWGDFNNDGSIDLAITYPTGFVPPFNNPTINHLLLNDGPPNYTFTRVTTNNPIVTSGSAAYTIVTWSDHDMDGDLDCFMGAGPADGTTAKDFLFRNLLVETGTDTFERINDSPIATDLQDGQIWNWIDYDNDGDLDAYLANWWGGLSAGMPNRLYRNDGESFTSITSGNIVQDAARSLSSLWEDFDNDGDLDCFVTNDGTPPVGQFDRYYQNNGNGTFTRITSIAIAEALAHRGASAGDYDNDGKIDLLSVGPGTQKVLYHNDTQNGNGWITIKCIGIISNKAAIGAKVLAKATINDGPVWQLREISAQNTFNGHNSLWPHFGFGDATIIDSLKFEWPSGIVQTLTSVSVNQFLTVEEDTTLTLINVVPQPMISEFQLYQNYPNPFNPVTTIEYYLPISSHVALKVFDLLGREVKVLVNGNQTTGLKDIHWDGTNQSNQKVVSGIYIYRLVAGGFVQNRKMILLR